MDTTNELTERQKAFVSYYLGEARFNGTKAASLAGYSNPRQSATENLAKPYIRKYIDAYFEDLKHEGLRNTNVRIQALTRTMESLDAIVEANAKEAHEALERGERVPDAALEGFHVRDTKIAANGKTVTQWILDKNLLAERRATLDQIGKELNAYVQKTELTGKDGGPIELLTADLAYDALLDELSD